MHKVLLFACAFFIVLKGYAQGSTYEPVDRALDLEDPTSALFFLNRIPNTDAGHQLRKVEILYCQRDFREAQLVLDSIPQLSLSPEQSAYASWYKSELMYQLQKSTDGLDEARHGLKTLAEIKSPPLRIKAGLLSIEGLLLIDGRDFPASEKALGEALELYRHDSARYYVRISHCHYDLGIAYLRQGKLTDAEQQTLLAKTILENNPLDKRADLVKAYNLLGNIYSRGDDYLHAKQSYLRCIDLNLHLEKDTLRLTIPLGNLGAFFTNYGNYTEAEHYFLEAISFINPKNPYQLLPAANFYLNAGVVYDRMGQPYKALNYLRQSREYYQQLPDVESTYPECLINLASVSIEVKALDDAKRYLDEAAQVMAKMKDVTVQNRVLYLVNRSNLAAGSNREAALPILKQAKALLDSGSVRNDLKGDVYFNLGVNYMVSNNPADAYANLRIARETYARLGDRTPPVIMTIDQLGVAHYRSGDLDSAAYYFRTSLENNTLPDSVVSGNGFPHFVEPFEAIVASYYLAKISIDRFIQGQLPIDQLEQAESYILLGQNLINDQRKSTREEKDNINFGTSVQGFFETGIRFYYILYARTKDPAYVERSFVLSEMAKNQTMQTTLRDMRIREFAGVTQRLVQRENQLVNKTSSLEAQLAHELSYGENANTDLVDEYRTAWRQELASRNEFLDSMKRNIPDYYNLKFNNNLISLNTLQRDIVEHNPKQFLVEFFVGENDIYAQCLWKNQATVVRIPNVQQISKLTQGLTNAIKFEAADRIIDLGTTLYKDLLSPVDSVLGNDRRDLDKMIVVPDGFLCYLPFELLQPPSRKTPHYLVEDFAISYGYSSTLLWQEFAGEPSFALRPGEHFLGIAPEFGKPGETPNVSPTRTSEESATDETVMNLDPLPQNRNEVEGVADYLRKRSLDTTLVLGEAASEITFKKTDLSNYAIIHLATHGVIDTADPDRSGIAFSRSPSSGEDGILFVHEIFNLRTRADLVCLSACETGFGEVVKGEGIMGMSRAFIYSGSKNLVVSLWSVPDRNTAVLMDDFYKALAQNHSIPEALRIAKLDLIKSSANQPEQWAGFIHIGI